MFPSNLVSEEPERFAFSYKSFSHAWRVTGSVVCILGFHVTSEKTKLKNFKFLPSAGLSSAR